MPREQTTAITAGTLLVGTVRFLIGQTTGPYLTQEEEDPSELDNCLQNDSAEMADILTVEVARAHSTHIPESPPVLERNSLLLALQRDRRNLVLDSLDPDHVPHIVISPPDDIWDLYWAAWINRVDPQSTNHLIVPPQDVSTPLAFLPPFAGVPKGRDGSVECGVSRHSDILSGTDSRTVLPHPPRVFSLSRFRQTIASASQERQVLFFDCVITAVHRHAFKACALIVCSLAPLFRARWDTPGFLQRFEKPFRWSDAAEPLLSFYRRCIGAIIIDSTTPCTTPHIVIQEPAPNNPWELSANVTSSPQDYGYGRFLTVPASYVDFVNVDESTFAGEDYCYYSASPASTPSPRSISKTNVLEPLTPDRFVSESTDRSVQPLLTSYADHGPSDCDSVAWPAGCTEGPQIVSRTGDRYYAIPMTDDIDDILLEGEPCVELYGATEPEEEDEEEDVEVEGEDEGEDVELEDGGEDKDDLPPFDDWYQEIAQRAHMQAPT
ncbi:hypothetical protein SCP_0211410 [Sparassis crispa]|uniref:Uncharacterized protein n=1 Tax=Sparassis crispa TaxID=139825 RepID=A0A401GCN3_9APHY|nr:hypothetical protein SCP_0211410 [Sparassis crispa]GBE79939.1 hypothetical protein SCP_0211410 [Sparassis crispa]